MEKSSQIKKKKFRKYVSIVFSIAVLLFVVLFIHIYMVTKPVHYDNSDLQLGRIDFKENIDSVEVVEVKHLVATLPGVHNVIFNSKDNILVFAYTVGKQTSENIYQAVMNHKTYKAEKFKLDEKLLMQGCPMAGKDRSSFIYRTSAYIYKLLN